MAEDFFPVLPEIVRSDVEKNTTPERLPVIKINKDGFFVFLVNGNKIVIQEFKGVILKHHACRAYWQNGGVAGSRPDCTSNNGIFAVSGERGCPLPPQVRSENLKMYGNELVCSDCPMNVWGSALGNGRGKACSERHRFFVVAIEGDLASAVPYSLTISPTSLSGKDCFFFKLTEKRIPVQTIVTRFSLDKKKNETGKPFAKLVLKANPTERLPFKDQLVMLKLFDLFEAGLEQAINDDDIGSVPEPKHKHQEYPKTEEKVF